MKAITLCIIVVAVSLQLAETRSQEINGRGNGTESFPSFFFNWLYKIYSDYRERDTPVPSPGQSTKVPARNRTSRQLLPVLSPAEVLLLQQQQQRQQALALAQLNQQIRNQYKEEEDSSEEEDDFDSDEFWSKNSGQRGKIGGGILPGGPNFYRSGEEFQDHPENVTPLIPEGRQETTTDDYYYYTDSTTDYVYTDEPTEPTDYTDEPTEPTDYTDEPTEPTDYTQEPTEPTDYTDYTQEPTEPTDYTDYTQEPTEPTDYTDYTQEPTEPTDYTDYTEEPTKPTEYPTEPTEEPTHPGGPLPYRAALDCRCGTQTKTKIPFDGTNLETDVYPWIVSIRTRKGNKHLCTGNIINSRYILTSATCLRGRDPDNLIVEASLATPGRTVKFPVKKVIIRSDFRPNKRENDIALLEVTRSIRPTKFIKFVCLPIGDRDKDATGTIVTLAKQPRRKQLSLIQDIVKPVWKKRCKTLLHQINTELPIKSFCTAPPARHCNGDTGGSFVTSGKGYSYAIKGIIITAGCSRSQQPAIYTQVTGYLSWILNRVRNGRFCKLPNFKHELQVHG